MQVTLVIMLAFFATIAALADDYGDMSAPPSRPQPIANTKDLGAVKSGETSTTNAIGNLAGKPGDTAATNAVNKAVGELSSAQNKFAKKGKDGYFDEKQVLIDSLNRAAALANTMQKFRETRGGSGASQPIDTGAQNSTGSSRSRASLQSFSQSSQPSPSYRVSIPQVRRELRDDPDVLSLSAKVNQPEISRTSFADIVLLDTNPINPSNELNSTGFEKSSGKERDEKTEMDQRRLTNNEAAVGYASPLLETHDANEQEMPDAEEAIEGGVTPNEIDAPPQNVSANSVSLQDTSPEEENSSPESITQKVLAGARAIAAEAAKSQKIVAIASSIPGFMKLVAETKAWVAARNEEHAKSSAHGRSPASIYANLSGTQPNGLDVLIFLAFLVSGVIFSFSIYLFASPMRKRSRR